MDRSKTSQGASAPPTRLYPGLPPRSAPPSCPEADVAKDRLESAADNAASEWRRQVPRAEVDDLQVIPRTHVSSRVVT